MMLKYTSYMQGALIKLLMWALGTTTYVCVNLSKTELETNENGKMSYWCNLFTLMGP